MNATGSVSAHAPILQLRGIQEIVIRYSDNDSFVK